MPKLPTALAIIALGIALVVGGYLRTSRLDLRPMHTDEAIQADRLGQLIEGGGFDYNSKDGHGPGLLYIAAPVARLSGAKSYQELTETLVRMAPALCGIALIAAAALFWKILGAPGVVCAALLTALSPMHVYYSRYFIMEVPMVLQLALFLFCLWRYLERPGFAWMVLGGVCAGWMHATKETFAISIVALGAGLVAVLGLAAVRKAESPLPPVREWLKHALAGLGVSLVVSAALYTGFFTNLGAVGDSYATYLHYLDRSEGSGHEKPFNYYIELLSWKKTELFTWTEALVLLLAIIGAAAAFLRRDLTPNARLFLRVLTIYAAATLLIYSALAYKTPWSILAFLNACVLLAGAGFAWLMRLNLKPVPRALTQGLVILAVLAGAANLYRQNKVANFQFPASEDRNPYVYSHTTPSLVSKLVAQVDELEGIKPELTVQVFHPETGWPLPWYFRDIKRAGYYPTVTGPVVGDVVIADEAYSETLQPLLGDRYIGPDPRNLRENVLLHTFVEKELFFEMVSRRPVTMP